MAAVLACGERAVLSHASAAALWGIRRPGTRIEVSLPVSAHPRPPGVTVHRRSVLTGADVTRRDGIPVTSPLCTLVDLATCLGPDALEAAVNEADKLGLVAADSIVAELGTTGRRRGAAILRAVVERHTFVLTGSDLERRFARIARGAGLPRPQTGRWLNGFLVDFFWPQLGLVVETDGLRYHRTPAQQARDRARDQAHAAAGLTPLRFTHAQVAFDPGHVARTLRVVANRLGARGG